MSLKYKGPIATVSRQEGDKIIIAIPLRGCPAGFKLRQGDKVVVAYDPEGTSARPLRVGAVVDVPLEKLGNSFKARNGQAYVTQPATSRPKPQAGKNRTLVLAIESSNTKEPLNVVGLRPER